MYLWLGILKWRMLSAINKSKHFAWRKIPVIETSTQDVAHKNASVCMSRLLDDSAANIAFE